MQYYYGQQMPLRVLDEIEFWKQQEGEHTVVIQELVDGLEPQYVNMLEKWRQAFFQTQGLAVRYIASINQSEYPLNPMLHQQILELANHSLRESQQFIYFLNQVMEESDAIKGNLTAVVVLNHIRRESEYFIGIAQKL